MDKFNDISTSGPVAPQTVNVSDCFTGYKELPSSGYSRLFCAQRYGQWHVLKGLKPEYADDPQYTAMLSKEFALTVELNHPNIVRALGHEQDPVAGDCIVLEYVDGRPLDEFLKENPSLSAPPTVLRKVPGVLPKTNMTSLARRMPTSPPVMRAGLTCSVGYERMGRWCRMLSAMVDIYGEYRLLPWWPRGMFAGRLLGICRLGRL